MSWQQFVDDQLMCTLPGGGQLKHAAIWGHDGGVWACDARLTCQVDCLVCVFKLGRKLNDPRACLQQHTKAHSCRPIDAARCNINVGMSS